jgi:hypothetical protein
MAAIVGAFGENNMDFTSEVYEKNGNYAAKWCNDLSAGGYSDWYLPTANDLSEVYAAKESLANLVSLQNGYWTSDHLGDYLAWAYYFEADRKHPVLKFQLKNVRAIHEVQFGETLDDMYNAGGGVFLGKNGVLRNCVVRNNESPSIGGGIFAGKGAAVSNCLVYGNSSQKEGSGIYASADNAESGATTVINTTIAGNTGDNGYVSDNSAAQLLNSIVWGNTNAGSVSNIAGSGQASFSCIEGGTTGNDNINANPSFVDTGAGKYDLQNESPSINTGSTALYDPTKWGDKDVTGKNRIVGRIDMGACENQSVTAIGNVQVDGSSLLGYYIKDSYLYLTGIQVNDAKLYNLNGQLAGHSASGSIYLPQTGVYIVKVTTGDKLYIQKIVW